MLSKQEALINEGVSYFKRGDHSLGYRTLLDAALNTDATEVFKETIQFVETYESTEEKATLLSRIEKYAAFLKTIPVETSALLGEEILNGQNLSKAYRNSKFALGPINIQLKKGGIYGLVGENGNGKTTLLTILASLIKTTSGKLTYNFLTESKDAFDLKSKLVYIPQRTDVWYGSVIDNLKFALAHHGVKGEKNELLVLMMIARFGLWKYRKLKWKELSSGYKMRFELARTLLRRPEIILLDEPLANLDILAQQVILEDLKMLAKSHANPIAMVFSSQQLYEVEKISDEVIYLRDGKPSEALEKAEEDGSLIVELDTENTRESIEELFKEINLQKVEFNGGVYILYFKEPTTFNDLLLKIAKANFSIKYIRDISASTRRYFVY
ncbi:ABC transporter ATP-binding protein [Tenacibaculum sp. 190524A02b]|uniref:ABC transporter ATP-binding protein n=1 Tax=Tenacibaculum vairaonense TaxID=3137860 RepID=UPI0032B14E19